LKAPVVVAICLVGIVWLEAVYHGVRSRWH